MRRLKVRFVPRGALTAGIKFEAWTHGAWAGERGAVKSADLCMTLCRLGVKLGELRGSD